MANITDLCKLIEAERHDRYLNGFEILVQDAIDKGRRTYKEIGYDEGSKFQRVWEWNGTQKSVVVFVEKATGIIYGADGWKKPNFKRQYGTLDTINDWDWSEYYATSKKGLDTLVPKSQRRKATR